ncbi:SphA family protein [Bradyrhizobium sp.]|uniref:SphA family protein n=1 Tax=Bradyrhizobium sp. TaxID=376 RepID=UPI003C45DF16
MAFNCKTLLVVAGLAVLSGSPGYAMEGLVAPQSKAGVFIGASAGVPPPGIYMFNQVFTYQSNLTGPGTSAIGTKTGVQAAVDVQGFLFVPGWTFLGATYDAVIVQPFVMQNFGSPINVEQSGAHNTYIVPVELSWKLADSGFAVKTGVGIYTPDGTVNGVFGTGNTGNAFWTFQPEVIVSYLKDGWNLSAAVYEEFNTRNTVSQYTSGDILHADFTATKTIGKWTFGPVAYYVGQVSNDSCTATCLYPGGTNAILANAQRFNVWAVGGLVGYDFGPAALSVWATQEVSAKASNAAAVAATGADPSLVAEGTTVFATLSYRLWAPDQPAPTKPMFHK